MLQHSNDKQPTVDENAIKKLIPKSTARYTQKIAIVTNLLLRTDSVSKLGANFVAIHQRMAEIHCLQKSTAQNRSAANYEHRTLPHQPFSAVNGVQSSNNGIETGHLTCLCVSTHASSHSLRSDSDSLLS